MLQSILSIVKKLTIEVITTYETYESIPAQYRRNPVDDIIKIITMFSIVAISTLFFMSAFLLLN